MNNTLTISSELFLVMISGLIASGVRFEAEEQKNGDILVTFTGGY
jgi:hypothetical protein